MEIALIGDPADARTRALDAVLAESFLPRRIIARGDGSAAATHPLVAGKTLVNGAPAAYVCRNYACEAPITDPERLRAALLK